MALTDNLVNYWKFDETSGSTASDSVGTNNGTLSNTRVFSGAAAGKINTCADFTQGDDNITMTSVGATKTGNNHAISLWIWIPSSFSSDVTRRGFFGWDSNQWTAVLMKETDNKLYFRVLDSGAWETVGSTSAYNGNAWNHVVGLMNYNGTSYLYLNGSLIGTGQACTGQQTGRVNTAKFGLSYQYFDAQGRVKVDEVGVWKRTLTTDEIASLYNSGNGFAYPFVSGWSKKIDGITPNKVDNVSKTNISKINNV